MHHINKIRPSQAWHWSTYIWHGVTPGSPRHTRPGADCQVGHAQPIRPLIHRPTAASPDRYVDAHGRCAPGAESGSAARRQKILQAARPLIVRDFSFDETRHAPRSDFLGCGQADAAGAKRSGGSIVSTWCGRGGSSHAQPHEGQRKNSLPDARSCTKRASPMMLHTQHSPAEKSTAISLEVGP